MSYRAFARHALRYGTFWPGALAQDSYNMYKKRRRSQSQRPAKRARTTATRAAYRPKMRSRMSSKKKGTSKFSRWNKNKRSIPNVQVNPFRFFRNTCTLASKPGAALEWKCLTDIPSASHGFNNVKLKSFDIDLKFMPVTGANQPTWLRFAIVVQTGVYADPIATNLIGGLSHSDNYINMSTDREGWMNRTFPLNSMYKVIYAKTLMMAPLLEAGATSVQSNLSAQIAIRQRVKYPKFIQYDSGTDNVPLTNNV